jgi:hypothetical protein
MVLFDWKIRPKTTYFDIWSRPTWLVKLDKKLGNQKNN